MNRWRSVKEDPPEYMQDVLVKFFSGTIAVGYKNPLYDCWHMNCDDNQDIVCDSEPVYWQPLNCE